jgi:hypothetical protein
LACAFDVGQHRRGFGERYQFFGPNYQAGCPYNAPIHRQRAEITRMKALNGPPTIKPSGMAQASEPVVASASVAAAGSSFGGI